MIFDDNTIDFKNELKKSNNELSNLKQKYQELEADRDYIKSLLNRSHEHNYKLKKENEQLKQTIKSVYELLTIEIDVFSDKAIEHDLIAYRELQQLDNKDAYYMAISTKKAIKMLKGDVE